jgi:TRAP-type uncharacterized transport system fused permease subunit
MAIIALLMLGYAFAGPYMPDAIAHKGISLSKAVSHYWLSTEGVFGVAMRASSNYIFLFVLFGGPIEKAGAGSDFIKVAYALLGHLRGEPHAEIVRNAILPAAISYIALFYIAHLEALKLGIQGLPRAVGASAPGP